MKRLIFLILVVSIVIFGCDRFERDFMTVDEFVDEFRITAGNALRENNIPLFMSFFSDSYLNNGIDRDSLAYFIADREWSEETLMIVSPAIGSRTRFSMTVQDNGFVHRWSDVLRLESGRYIWYGNQLNHLEPRQVVLAQVFTALQCINCPNASDALHAISEVFPDNFIYLKYHVDRDSLSLYDSFADERRYYNANVQPIVVFQGQRRIMGGTPAQTGQYAQIVQDLLIQEAAISMDDLRHSVNNRTITGSVVLNYAALNTNNLYLFYAVYEKETTAYYQVGPSAGMLATNVVRGRGSQPINPVSGQRIHFELEAQRYLDDDTYLVVWVQSIEDINSQSPQDAILSAVRVKLF